MPTEAFILIAAAAPLLMAALTPLCSPAARWLMGRRRNTEAEEVADESDATADEPVSIIVVAYNYAEHLEDKLRALLAQRYAGHVQIVVVRSHDDHATDDIIKRLNADTERIYGTFIPERSRYMSREKLAITVGIKAAAHDTVVLADARTTPCGDDWLEGIVVAMHGHDIAATYATYDDEAPDYWRYLRLTAAMPLLRRAVRQRPFTTNSTVVAFSRRAFTEQDIFRDNLQYSCSELEFLANRLSLHGGSSAAPLTASRCIDDTPTHKQWRTQQLCQYNTKGDLKGLGKLRALFVADHLLLHLTLIAILCAGAAAWLLQDVILGASAAASLIVLIALRTTFAAKAQRDFGEEIPAWKLFAYDWRTAITRLHLRLRYWLSDKYDYTTHKL